MLVPVLIGVAVFVVLGAVAALKFGDWVTKAQKRRVNDAARRREAEDEVW